MTQPLSHKFIAELEGPRDRLYTAALAKTAGDTRAAEDLLQAKCRELFGQFARDAVTDVPGVMLTSLVSESVASVATETAEVPMPADVWARLAANVQLEAAQSNHAKALNPDSVLLKPDPLLAPKKAAPRRDDDNFDLTSPSRLIVVGGAFILIAVVVTIYIMTRPASPHPTTQPAPQTLRGIGAASTSAPTTLPPVTLPGGTP